MRLFVILLSLLFALQGSIGCAQDEDVLTEEEWTEVDKAVERGLAWLALQQQRDGSFPTMPLGQPAVSGLCELAFLAHGHLPGEGIYGEKLTRTVGYVAGCQKANGLLTLIGPRGPTITRQVSHEIGSTASYNHAIATLVLSENFSVGGGEIAQQLDPVIQKAIAATLLMQKWPKRRDVDLGGWRYVDVFSGEERDFDSDLSATGWYLMSLRSAKNAGFDVPQKPIDDAVRYVRRCFQPEYGAFQLMATDSDRRSRGMAGAGILALAHAGFHNAPETKLAGDWILQHPFNAYNVKETFGSVGWVNDRYHYGAFNCCQAMYQLGGHYWRDFFPPLVRTLLAAQQPDGSWQREDHVEDGKYGTAYSTALVLLSLGAPNQLLPVFQR
jgi:hypothetical protein